MIYGIKKNTALKSEESEEKSDTAPQTVILLKNANYMEDIFILPGAVKDSLPYFAIFRLDLRCLSRRPLCDWLGEEETNILLQTKIQMENNADNNVQVGNLPSRIESTTRFLKRYIYVINFIGELNPNGTSANGTRSPMRGTLPFYTQYINYSY